jgi:hypothetical protein
MKRLPGKPEDKLKILKSINEKQFPYLVADVLHEIFRHTDVKVMDGPVDGRRDIHSLNPDGKLHITQCKYHRNVLATVGSRETDEIIIALSKFGALYGTFATTGRLTPPAKREYIENFPQYHLQYLEGMDLVDHILSHPVLAAVWYANERIEATRYCLAIPFIVRKAERDIPLKQFAGLPELLGDTHRLSYVDELVATSSLTPYRAPKHPSMHEFGSSFRCTHVVCTGAIYTHEVEFLTNEIKQGICKAIADSEEVRTIRFGHPFYAPSLDQLKINTEIKSIEPISFVVTKNRIEEEADWIIPSYRPDWIFPERFGHLEADWACWHNEQLNCNFVLEIDSPIQEHPNFIARALDDLKKARIKASLFAIGTSKEVDEVNITLTDLDKPNWTCKYGEGNVAFGWLHPGLIDNRPLISDWEGDGLLLPQNLLDEKFEEQKVRIAEILTSLNIEQITSERAQHIAGAANQHLHQDVELVRYQTAELFHFFDETVSPVYLQGRQGLFVSMWEIPAPLDEIRTVLSSVAVDMPVLPFDLEIHTQVMNSQALERVHAMFTLKFLWPLNLSTDDYLNILTPHLPECLERIRIFLTHHWLDSRLATKNFWNQEIGMYF